MDKVEYCITNTRKYNLRIKVKEVFFDFEKLIEDHSSKKYAQLDFPSDMLFCYNHTIQMP